MTRASNARRIATAALYGGGSAVGIGAAALGVLVAEGLMAKRTIGLRKKSAPYADGIYGPRRRGTSLRLVVFGDSIAAGLGADSSLDTVGALLAQGLAGAADRPVRLVVVATVGARSADLDAQVTRALILQPHVAVVIIGGNDITHLTRPQSAIRDLEQGVERLVDAGAEVIVGTCPDVGTIRPIRQPLRSVARRLSRQLAAAQTIAVVEAGGRSVSLGDLLGPHFEEHADDMFAHDRFHPSSIGYEATAQVLLPSVLDSLALLETDQRTTEDRRGEQVVPVAMAAISAVDRVGTEVVASQVGGDTRGRSGRWAQIRHRILRPIGRAEPPMPLSEEDQADADITSDTADTTSEPTQ
ncbi:MAG: SGNH/GDSL hydrolase family protein [Actinobacteria bacterium]|nr:SGNH/GDSL hydrolase family protein [Actinomycetota bacterium]